MAQADTSMAIADSITEQYAGVMDDLIADCTRLEEKNADLQRQLAVALQVRNAAIVARDQARRERDEARTRAHEGDVGDVDLRSYCECCDRYWHRNYVAWFERPVTTDTGRTISSACGACFERVPELDPVH
eukprot:COSAG06_NODE_320_length_17586_cov_9.121347_8_plen_131_part_00